MNTWYAEWELIQRKRAFRLVHVPFLLARYITLTALLFLYVLHAFFCAFLSWGQVVLTCASRLKCPAASSPDA